jgi:hypothetical protein
MPNVREPLLNPVPITEVRPTQITVGMREVKAKRKRWREEGDTKGAEFLGKHMIPVILGPKQPLCHRSSPSRPRAARRRRQGHTRHGRSEPKQAGKGRLLGGARQPQLDASVRRSGPPT